MNQEKFITAVNYFILGYIIANLGYISCTTLMLLYFAERALHLGVDDVVVLLGDIVVPKLVRLCLVYFSSKDSEHSLEREKDLIVSIQNKLSLVKHIRYMNQVKNSFLGRLYLVFFLDEEVAVHSRHSLYPPRPSSILMSSSLSDSPNPFVKVE